VLSKKTEKLSAIKSSVRPQLTVLSCFDFHRIKNKAKKKVLNINITSRKIPELSCSKSWSL
jgi:hypothetical protein